MAFQFILKQDPKRPSAHLEAVGKGAVTYSNTGTFYYFCYFFDGM